MPVNNKSPWTEPVSRRLIELYWKHSSRTIARMLSEEFGLEIPRNAVVGRSRRMIEAGLMTPPGVTSPPIAIVVEPQPVEEELPPLEETPPPPPIVQKPQPKQFTIYDLNSNVCKWPLGKHDDYPPYFYCGMPAFADRPYCPEHCDIAYNAPGKRWQ